MTNEEIELMKTNIQQGDMIRKQSGNPMWIKAFEEFNLENEKNLKMGCYSCYGKVLHYHTLKNKNLKGDE